jgi:hypothetical protein
MPITCPYPAEHFTFLIRSVDGHQVSLAQTIRPPSPVTCTPEQQDLGLDEPGEHLRCLICTVGQKADI